ncbi:hypothetical protein GCM10010869_62410 [Mesorhizobium tianshanense]|uniref:Aldehyde dehydrogenase family protein n=1 Tax=Mesorhizobium tianshanense TaxID=39844 RepID=A0A562MKF5_9HYPH|nr:aldehyde dehydrogenase family protein [Mesorhizobium tianshanense]GLS40644.1 hypothetical protein GCM10010869_62410 [Mesorhizobium tianshanense]
MAAAQEETFGPLAPIIRFNDADQVVREANDTIYGLAAYFYASNLKRVWRVAEALEYGMVGINTGRMSSKAAPSGGIKQSGIGREGSRHGLEELPRNEIPLRGRDLKHLLARFADRVIEQAISDYANVGLLLDVKPTGGSATRADAILKC